MWLPISSAPFSSMLCLKSQKKVPQGYLAMCKRVCVLSVSAAWSDVAKNATLDAAKKAGAFPVASNKEPEAAALYTMHSMKFELHVGDAFIVCDAGGGTVDLISIEVMAITPRPQLKELKPDANPISFFR
jgi:molecular chaperone DnaK (HSP70)